MIGKNQCRHGSLKRSCEICELESERDALKAELENQKKLNQDYFVPEIIEDRDRWRSIAERLAEALSRARGQWIHSVNKDICLKALSAYDAMKKGEK